MEIVFKPGLCAMWLIHRRFFLGGVLRARWPFPLPNRRAICSSATLAGNALVLQHLRVLNAQTAVALNGLSNPFKAAFRPSCAGPADTI